jgi:hypothetical protein
VEDGIIINGNRFSSDSDHQSSQASSEKELTLASTSDHSIVGAIGGNEVPQDDCFLDDTSTLLSSSDTESEDEDDEEEEQNGRSSSSSSDDDWDALTVDSVLQPPIWSHDLKLTSFSSLTALEDYLMQLQDVVQQELVRHDYNTFTSFVGFYQDYMKYKSNEREIENAGMKHGSFLNFVNKYDNLKEETGSLSCVGLSESLIAKVGRLLGGRFEGHVSLVSCEEVVKDVGSYSIDSPNNLKEHVMIAMKICLRDEGRDRSGFILMDPGYHVARPVVIMLDNKYPHTGWFVQSHSKSIVKEYCYDVIDDRFLAWNVKETRRGVTTSYSNLIFVKKQFESFLSITKKRSLLYAFKSYVIRDRKGPIAGIYCWLRSQSITLFYPGKKDPEEKINVKFPIEGKCFIWYSL